MTLTDVKVKSTVSTDKYYKLTDGEGMHLTFCHMLGVHSSSHRQLKNRPEKPDGR